MRGASWGYLQREICDHEPVFRNQRSQVPPSRPRTIVVVSRVVMDSQVKALEVSRGTKNQTLARRLRPPVWR